MTAEATDMSAPEPVVKVETVGDVLVIRLNRPKVRNAINFEVAKRIAEALDRLDDVAELKAGVITGEGGYFCSGMDLKAFGEGERPHVGDRGFAGIVRRASRKPLIAAVEGVAVAGGFEVALACDLIIAANGTRFGIPEVKRSLVARGGALLRLPERLPYNIVMEMALTGDMVSAERLAELGVVNRLAEPGEALADALELARAISKNGPLGVEASKRILSEQRDWTLAEMWEKQAEIADPVFASADAKEGARAFVEKRDPVWRRE